MENLFDRQRRRLSDSAGADKDGLLLEPELPKALTPEAERLVANYVLDVAARAGRSEAIRTILKIALRGSANPETGGSYVE